MWNAVTYFDAIAKRLKATKQHKFCRVSGIGALEDILQSYNQNAYFAVDDSDDGITIQKGGGYFDQRSVVIYILQKYKITNMVEREQVLATCRKIRKSIISKLIVDSNNQIQGLEYLDKKRFPYHEVPEYFAAGTAGVYFSITIEEPVSLIYDSDEWD
jgi:hypothetical protein